MMNYMLTFKDSPVTTTVLICDDIIKQLKNKIQDYGKKCLIATGKSGAKISGALQDVLKIVQDEKLEYSLFEEIEPNPTIETCNKCIELNKTQNISFIIAIGGGSVMDASKAIGFGLGGVDYLKADDAKKCLPLICVPTAAGTGSEVTQYSVLTSHELKTKICIPNYKCPNYSFVNPNYLKSLPMEQIVSMYFDIMCHSIESALTVKSCHVQQKYSKLALQQLSECKTLLDDQRSPELHEAMCLASVYAGIAISISGTSLPHGLSYYLTYNHKISHGLACAAFLPAYLEICDQKAISELLSDLKQSKSELAKTIQKFIQKESFQTSVENKKQHAQSIISSGKAKAHSETITIDEIVQIW